MGVLGSRENGVKKFMEQGAWSMASKRPGSRGQKKVI